MNVSPLLHHMARHVILPDSDAITIAGWLREKAIERKTWLLQAGEVCTLESFVVKGCFRTLVTNPDGQEHVLFFSVENWWVSDLSSFLTHAPATYSIQAMENSRLLQLSKTGFDALNAASPPFADYFRILFQNSYIAQQRRVVQNLSLTAAERYEVFLRTWPRLEQRVAQKEIASFLGITPEFLSLIRRKRAGR